MNRQLRDRQPINLGLPEFLLNDFGLKCLRGMLERLQKVTKLIDGSDVGAVEGRDRILLGANAADAGSVEICDCKFRSGP